MDRVQAISIEPASFSANQEKIQIKVTIALKTEENNWL
jgi:hypothetical protein